MVKLQANRRPRLKQKDGKHVRTNRRGWPPHAHGYAYPPTGTCGSLRACTRPFLPLQPALTAPVSHTPFPNFLFCLPLLSAPTLRGLSLSPQNSSGILSLSYDRSCMCFAIMTHMCPAAAVLVLQRVHSTSGEEGSGRGGWRLAEAPPPSHWLLGLQPATEFSSSSPSSFL